MFQSRVTLLGLNSGRPVSINVNKTMEHFSRNIHGAHIFNQCFPVCYTGNIVSSVSFCFQDSNYAYVRYTAGNFNENPSMRAVAKFCEHEQASTHLIFWEQFEQRPNFASTFKLVETIRYPSVSLCHFIIATRPLSEAIIRLTLHELLLDSLHLFMKNV